MGYTFHANEGACSAIRRIATEQLSAAIEALARKDGGDQNGVHEARQHVKRTRALLRLVRYAYADSFQKENRRLRDCGRRLSTVRDAEAVLEAFDALRKRFEEKLSPEAYDAIRQGLAVRRERIAGEQTDVCDRVSEVVDDLGEACRRASRWNLTACGFDAIGPGYRETYRLGRKSMKRTISNSAASNTADERLHEWRKRVKDHWYHVRMLKKTWPEVMESRQSELKRLSDFLGDNHDLAVLRGMLEHEPAEFGKPDSVGRAMKLIDRRRAELLSDARSLGSRIYAGKPAAKVRELHAYWKAWHAEKRASARG